MNDTKHHRPKALETPTIFHVLPLFGGSLDFNYLLVSISHAPFLIVNIHIAART